MSVYVNIFIIAVAFILAVSRIGFSYIKKRDRDQGLYLNDRAYTLLGTLRACFMSKDKRIEYETVESFSDYLKRSPGSLKVWRTIAVSYMALLLLTGLLSITLKGMNIYAVMDFSLVIVGMSLFLSKHGSLVYAALFFGIIAFLFEVSEGSFIQIIALFSGIALFASAMILKRRYRKERVAISKRG